MSFLQSQNEHTVDKLNEEISTLSDSIFNIKASIESDSTVVKLNEEISTLRDSIFNIKASFSQDSKTADKNDFLNNYFFDQIPLPNNSFQLVLSKIIFGNSHVDGHYAHNSVLSIPEILDAKAFHYWTAKTDVVITSNSNFKDYLVLKNEEYFDSKLPQIEILKNKLFTILYNDGSEESFLFNVNEPEDPNQYNNQRKIIQINLANEEVKDNASNDIVWRIFPIDNECYLALTYLQLNRLKLHLKSSVDGLEVYWEDYGKRSFDQSDFAYQNQKNNTVTTTGNGIYLSRDKDSYMDTSSYINPENLIFLIKLK